MHPNAQLIEKFYTAFQSSDADEANRIHLYIESNPFNWAEGEENK